MKNDGNESRELDPEEVALIEHAKRIMQRDLNQVHTRGQLTDYFTEASVAFMTATSAYALGNVLVAMEAMPEQTPKLKKLVLEAVEAIKALHLALRMGATDDIEVRGGRIPGEPPPHTQ